MKINPSSWFEIPVTDKHRASNFYSTVFGRTFERQKRGEIEMAFFPMDDKAPGAPGALIAGPDTYQPGTDGPLVYLYTTEPIDKLINKIEKTGGEVVTEKADIGKHGFVVHFIDTEGNKLALHSKS